MWLLHYSVCLFKGHDCSDLTRSGKAFTYCHRCGRVKESRPARAGAARRDATVASSGPVAAMLPTEKSWR